MNVVPVHDPNESEPSKRYDPREWELRCDLAACYRLVQHHGWNTNVYNHITVRIPGHDEFLINPFGLAYDEIRASNLIRIDIDGNKLEDSPHPVNQAGYVIHSAIHAARPDVHCVLHTHSENATAIACTQTGFIPMTQTGCMFFERIGYHEFEGIALDEAERARLIADLGPDNHTMLLYNHGLITTGPSIAWAFSRLWRFEEAAGVQLKAMATGQPLKLPNPSVVRKTREQYESGAARAGSSDSTPEWPAFLRLVERLDPSWRQ